MSSSAQSPSATEVVPQSSSRVALPPFLLGMALLFWGWQQGAIAYALPLAIIVESARWVPWRWNFTDQEFNRISDLSALILVLTVIYIYDSHSFRGIYVLLKWLPANLFLLVGAQLFSTRDEIHYTALFWSVRRAVARGTYRENRALDFRPPYLVAVLLAATGGTIRGPGMFIGLTVAIIWLLWANRPQRWSVRAWVVVMVLATGFAVVNQQGLVKVRRVLEPYFVEWFRDRIWNYRDPYQSYTALGQIGALKQSDRIVLRVTPLDRGPVPTLLREATYSTFSRNIWLASDSRFTTMTPDIEGTHWELEKGVELPRRIRIARTMRRGKGLLPVPNGTFAIDNLPVEDLHRNSMGALKVLTGPGLVSYSASFDPEQSFDVPPGEGDLIVPADLKTVMATVAEELGLNDATVSEAVRRLHEHFLRNFEYTVLLRRPTRAQSPLQDFLLTSRRGHCEFFATASVLLLRQAGIPARYATGYSVQEYSELEQRYLVRRRHSHSWVLAYLDGRWQDVDTTPPSWGEIEGANAQWWQGMYDLVSWLRFHFDQWRWSAQDEEDEFEVLWLAIPLSLLLLWRLYFSERVSFARKPAITTAGLQERPGGDSDLYHIESYLKAKGFPRRVDEPFSAFFDRLRASSIVSGCDEVIGEMLPVHYRYRFDPLGLSEQQRQHLRDLVRAWLKRHATD